MQSQRHTSEDAHDTLFHFANHEEDSDVVEPLDENDKQDILKTTTIPKTSGACMDCKSVKVRCEPVPGERKCRRCQLKNLPCRPRQRKKRKAADTHEELQAKARDQDIKIQQLLQEYDRLRADQKIRHWINKSLSTSEERESKERLALCYRWMQRGKSPEEAVYSYFGQGLSEYTVLPEIVKHCALFPEEIIELFSIFFRRINPYFSILDEGLHTPQNLIWTSPFLFTVICAVSSRHFQERPELYPLAMDFARDAAGKALVDGKRSVDICQAYLLMAVYPVPKKRWVEDKSWLLMGVAIRMAMELKLNQPPSDDIPEREALNRVRTWLNCYCVDGSHAIQFGKMCMLRLDDYVARSSAEWYRSSAMNNPFDVHLCAYVQIILIMGEWRAQMNARLTKGRDDVDVVDLAIRTQERLSSELDHWVEVYAREFSLLPLPICNYRGNTTQMITAYLKLVVLSIGFQEAFRRGMSRESSIFTKSLDAARAVIQIMVERLAPTGYLRYAMDANFLYVSYAAAFLINLLRPKFLPLLDDLQQKEIVITVTHLIGVLGSSDVALDGRHTPALYARFLNSLLNRYYPNVNGFYAPSSVPQDSKSSYGSPESNGYYWPDVSSETNSIPGPSRPDHRPRGTVYQQHGDPDMDFSLNHFVKTVQQDMPSHIQAQTELAEYTLDTFKGQQWDYRNQGMYWNAGSNFESTSIWRTDS